MPDPIRADVVALLRPAIGVKPASQWGVTTLGKTRIGGTPDAPHEFDWPKRAVSSDEMSKLDNAYEETREEATKTVSMTFIAQIDLREAHGLGDVAVELPSQGRLLFFWDQLIGDWISSPSTTRVIWDTTPVDQLAASPLPDDLRQEHEAYVKQVEERFSKTYESSSFFTPGRDATLYSSVMMPPNHAHIIEVKDEIERIESTEYVEQFFEFCEFDEHMNGPQWPKYQLLGLPHSVQPDPREEMKYFEFIDDPADWRLLFQVPFYDWDRRGGEGEIYFLIRKDDLKRHDFSGVRTVYQQT